jgi:hypothetical protein
MALNSHFLLSDMVKIQIIRGPLALFIHFLPFTLPKMLLVFCKEIDDSRGPQGQQSIFGLLGVSVYDLLSSRKRLFRVSPRLENSFSEICRQKMPLGRGQGNDLSRRQLALNSHFLPSYKFKIQIQRGPKSPI